MKRLRLYPAACKDNDGLVIHLTDSEDIVRLSRRLHSAANSGNVLDIDEVIDGKIMRCTVNPQAWSDWNIMDTV